MLYLRSLTATLGCALLALFTPRTMHAEPLAIGADAPAPPVVDHEGKPVDWAAVHAKGFALVYFYPKADTPGCTKQACSLRDSFAALTAKGVTVLGASGDTAEAQKAFREKYKLPFALVADTEGKLADAFHVPRKGTFASRQAFLFKDGKLVWLDTSAATDKQAEEVLAELAKLAP
jgi:peroxiredoxin Q/BCP